MSTKPEGPAPRRITCICGVSFMDNSAEMVEFHAPCPSARFINNKCPQCGSREALHYCVPATPTPSQGAVTNRFCTRCGKLNDGHQHEPSTRDRHDRPAFTGCCGTPTTGLSYVNPQHRADCPLRNAPSQPAGAREFAANYIEAHGSFPHSIDELAGMVHEYARQQTAAKDAEHDKHIAEFQQAVYEACKAVAQECGQPDHAIDGAGSDGDESEFTVTEVKQAFDLLRDAKEAAERERDSLREANARLAADLDAALKAGKDGQK